MANLEREWRSLRCKDGASETTHYDEHHTGLGLRCRASGGRSWTFEFRMPGDLKKARVVYGAAGDTPPALTYAQAKIERLKDVAGLTRTKKLEDGTELPDPLDPRQRRLAPIAPAAGTIREVLDLYFQAKLGDNAKRRQDGKPRGAKGVQDTKSRLERHLAKPHGKRQLVSFGRRDVAAILDASARKGHDGATKLLQRELGAFFKWCVGRDYLAAKPDRLLSCSPAPSPSHRPNSSSLLSRSGVSR
jgi:hypothetical protein